MKNPNLDQPIQDKLPCLDNPRPTYEAPAVVDYGNAAELTQVPTQLP